MDFRHLLEQAKNLEKNLARIEELLAQHESVGTAAGVEVRLNGVGDVLALTIAPELLEAGDAVALAKAVRAALQQAVDSSRSFRDEQRAELTGGLKLPDF